MKDAIQKYDEAVTQHYTKMRHLIDEGHANHREGIAELKQHAEELDRIVETKDDEIARLEAQLAALEQEVV